MKSNLLIGALIFAAGSAFGYWMGIKDIKEGPVGPPGPPGPAGTPGKNATHTRSTTAKKAAK